MKSLRIAAIFLALGTPALAQQPAIPDDTPITLTYGELNALVQARVADALAGNAMRHLNSQLAPPKPPAAAPTPAPAPAPPPPGSQD